ncbi:hypothetical protein KC19_6G044300 [Ceratodon purpureus]|uniref:Uncharacterized protein n=1 Tax=Ceratodon purpureus TaxID=3225 RepID=A0A8T0HA74_CERPU|nr:hypothetical protein KC19_6G044300 [Ceratodon purpureus]
MTQNGQIHETSLKRRLPLNQIHQCHQRHSSREYNLQLMNRDTTWQLSMPTLKLIANT